MSPLRPRTSVCLWLDEPEGFSASCHVGSSNEGSCSEPVVKSTTEYRECGLLDAGNKTGEPRSHRLLMNRIFFSIWLRGEDLWWGEERGFRSICFYAGKMEACYVGQEGTSSMLSYCASSFKPSVMVDTFRSAGCPVESIKS